MTTSSSTRVSWADRAVAVLALAAALVLPAGTAAAGPTASPSPTPTSAASSPSGAGATESLQVVAVGSDGASRATVVLDVAAGDTGTPPTVEVSDPAGGVLQSTVRPLVDDGVPVAVVVGAGDPARPDDVNVTRSAVADLLLRLGPEARFAVVGVGETPRLLTNPDGGLAAAVRAVTGHPVSAGSTVAAIQEAAEQVATEPTTPRILVVSAISADPVTVPASTLADQLADAVVLPYVVTSGFHTAYWESVVGRAGGAVLDVGELTAPGGRGLAQLLQSQYVVDVTASGGVPDALLVRAGSAETSVTVPSRETADAAPENVGQARPGDPRRASSAAWLPVVLALAVVGLLGLAVAARRLTSPARRGRRHGRRVGTPTDTARSARAMTLRRSVTHARPPAWRRRGSGRRRSPATSAQASVVVDAAASAAGASRATQVPGQRAVPGQHVRRGGLPLPRRRRKVPPIDVRPRS